MQHFGLRSVVAFLFVGLGGFTASADEPAPIAELDLEAAIELAQERSPRVRIARAQLDAAGSYSVLSSQPRTRNPLVTVRAMIGQPDAAAATYSALVGVPFDLSRRQPILGREAELIVDRAEADLLAATNDARADASAAYVEVAIATQLVAVAVARADAQRGTVERVRSQLAASASTAYDLAMAERELGEAEAAVAGARASLEGGYGLLRQALDLEPGARPGVRTLEVPTPSAMSVEQAIDRAIRERREPLALRAGAARYRMSEGRYRAEAIDPFFVGVEFEAQGNTQTQRTVGATATFAIPGIFTNQGERAIARSMASATDVEADVVERTIAREASVSHALLGSRIEQLQVLDASAIPAAERAVDLTEARLAVGSVDLFQLLTNRRGLYALLAFRLEVLREAWLARIALDRAMGLITSESP